MSSSSPFGSATPAQPLRFSSLGSATPSQPTSSSPFGSFTPAKPPSGFSFGSSTLDQPPSGFSFGSSTLHQPTSGISFGSSAAAKRTSNSSFRTATPAKPKSSSPFGLATAAKPTSVFSFGSSTPAQPITSSPVTALEALSNCTATTSTTCKIKPQTFTFPAVNQNGELKDTDSKEVFGFGQAPAPVVNAVSPAVKPPSWRNVQWTEERRSSLMKAVGSYTPGSEEVTQARVLLLGPVGSGKSSFISSVHSVFNGRVTNRAMVGASSTSFTKKLQSFNICGQKGKVSTKLVLCDSMGLGKGEMTGLTLHDILSVIKGHVPEGHKVTIPVMFSLVCNDLSCTNCCFLYLRMCLLYSDALSSVLSLDLLNTFLVFMAAEGFHMFSSMFGRRGRGEGYSAAKCNFTTSGTDVDTVCVCVCVSGIHQVALLTHVDEICARTATDVSMVYASEAIKETMRKAADLMGMSTSYIVPVKNYSSELDLDVNTDVLLLSAVEHILQYVDLFFQDNTPQETESEKIEL
ncbi:interferon-induced protein 44 [Platichthys flesus]|uniref:interferon-induced protein 44 n=1 Tax=Platichthys flesus TaxID=8260 RepID=UPI002DB89899|nr:interferon-induced protein 44 [Platichthys flesus]